MKNKESEEEEICTLRTINIKKGKTATVDELGRIKESEGKERKMGWEGGVRAHKLSNTCGPVRAQGKHHLVLIILWKD